MRIKQLATAIMLAIALPATAAGIQDTRVATNSSAQDWADQEGSVKISNVVSMSDAYDKVAELSLGAVINLNFTSGYGVPKYVAHLADEGKLRRVVINGETGDMSVDELYNPFPAEDAPTLSEKDAINRAKDLVTSGTPEAIHYEYEGGASEGAYRITIDDKDNDKMHVVLLSSKSGNVLVQSEDSYGFDWSIFNKAQPKKAMPLHAAKEAKTLETAMQGSEKLLDLTKSPANDTAAAKPQGFWDDWFLPEASTSIALTEAIDKAQAQVAGLTISANMKAHWNEDEYELNKRFAVRIFNKTHIDTVVLNAKDGSLVEVKEGPLKAIVALDTSRTSGNNIKTMITTTNEKSSNAQLVDFSIYRDADNSDKLTYVAVSLAADKMHITKFDAATSEFLSHNTHDL